MCKERRQGLGLICRQVEEAKPKKELEGVVGRLKYVKDVLTKALLELLDMSQQQWRPLLRGVHN